MKDKTGILRITVIIFQLITNAVRHSRLLTFVIKKHPFEKKTDV